MISDSSPPTPYLYYSKNSDYHNLKGKIGRAGYVLSAVLKGSEAIPCMDLMLSSSAEEFSASQNLGCCGPGLVGT